MVASVLNSGGSSTLGRTGGITAPVSKKELHESFSVGPFLETAHAEPSFSTWSAPVCKKDRATQAAIVVPGAAVAIAGDAAAGHVPDAGAHPPLEAGAPEGGPLRHS